MMSKRRDDDIDDYCNVDEDDDSTFSLSLLFSSTEISCVFLPSYFEWIILEKRDSMHATLLFLHTFVANARTNVSTENFSG